MVSHMSHEMVEFAYFRPSAQSVHLAGEFNPSQMDRVAMDRDDRGSWRVRIPLDPGEYRYQLSGGRLVVGGRLRRAWQRNGPQRRLDQRRPNPTPRGRDSIGMSATSLTAAMLLLDPDRDH